MKKNIKKFSLIVSFVMIGVITSFSQTVNDIPIEEYDVEYAQIIGTYSSTTFNIQIDFGHSHKAKDQRIIGTDGKQKKFNSMIEVLNFMSNYDYEYIGSHSGTGSQLGHIYYIIKKRKE